MILLAVHMQISTDDKTVAWETKQINTSNKKDLSQGDNAFERTESLDKTLIALRFEKYDIN